MNKFIYTYRAPTEEERKEIASIRRQYAPKTDSKLERLRKLHRKTTSLATALSLVLGVIGLLLFGLGLAMILEWDLLVWGILVAAVGGVPTSFAYPLYRSLYRKYKEKYGEEILRLSEELLNE